MRTSYKKEDVTMLLKDITGLVEPLPSSKREKLIQSGTHYSEMLPLEYVPSPTYFYEYEQALESFSKVTANAVVNVSRKIIEGKGKDVVLVSLARAGTPVGILIKRVLEEKYQISPEHYTISIIRGRGIDHNAMKYILSKHKPEQLQFIDGWTGKGAINNELKKELEAYPNVSRELAVLADPAYITELCGTHKDFLIPSSCLNSTVSGLISRTFLRKDIIGDNDFHGAHFYEEYLSEDVSYDFIDKILSCVDYDYREDTVAIGNHVSGLEEVKKIAKEFNIGDINLVKPGIGETTRVLLRRIPWKILMNSKTDAYYLKPILRLAEEKGIEVIEYPLECYKACGIIKEMAADL